MLKFGSGSSGKVNSVAAMEEALLQADAGSASVVLIHSTVGHNFAPMLSKAAATCPNATIVGCTGSGVIYSNGVNELMRALAVMSIAGPEVAVSFRDGVTSSNGRELATQAKPGLRGRPGPPTGAPAVSPGLPAPPRAPRNRWGRPARRSSQPPPAGPHRAPTRRRPLG